MRVTVCLLFLLLSPSLSDIVDTSRVCTFPSVACYDGSILITDKGNKYHSFQGIR